METGTATLIGATTENPSFEIIRPLLSRAQVYVLKPLTDTDLNELLHRAITCDSELKQRKVEVVETTHCSALPEATPARCSTSLTC